MFSKLLLVLQFLFYDSVQALSKTLSIDEQRYFKIQFALLEPNKNGTISLENIKEVRIISLVFPLSAIVIISVLRSRCFTPYPDLDEKWNRGNEGISNY